MAVLAALLSSAGAAVTRVNARLPSISKVTRGQKLTVGVEISHAELPPPPERGYGVSVHHKNLYEKSEEELRTLPILGMSASLRAAKVSCVAVRGMGELLTHVASEQAGAKGEFPGPTAVVYVPPVGEPLDAFDAKAVADAGASAVLLNSPASIPCSGDELDVALAQLSPAASAAAACGLEVMVELPVSASDEWDVAAAEAAFAKVESATSCAAMVLGLRAGKVQPLPGVFKGVMLASLRLPWSQIDDACDDLRAAGYCGALLRSECMPMAASTVSDWGEFWAGVVTNAKSNKSKTVTVMVGRQKKVDAMKAYVEKVKASGQFEVNDGISMGAADGIDSGRGDYLGF